MTQARVFGGTVRDRIPNASVMFCGYHFKLQCPFLLRFDYKKQQKVQGRPLNNMIWCGSLVFEGEPALPGAEGTAAGHRATTNSYIYIAIQQCAIRSPVEGTYVPVIHRFLYRGGEVRPTSEKELRKKLRYTRVLIASHGCRNPTAACTRLFQPSPDPQVLAKGGEVVICHGWTPPLIRSYRTAPSGRCRGIAVCDDGEGPASVASCTCGRSSSI
jgi:hypothetical protein